MIQPLMTLTACLDVNQVDDGIDWRFEDIDPLSTDDRTPTDTCWNRDINFSAGQEFRIAITVSDKERTGFESIEVVDCCLITRPRILCCGKEIRTRYAPPSLFVNSTGAQLGALYRIDPSAFSVLSTGTDSEEKGRRVTLLWDGHLTVGPYNGFWELTFYLTVRINRIGEDKAQLRVFCFDPESEVGNGTEPPN